LIPPGTEITLPAAEHWQYTVPRSQMLRIAYHLERAKGCIIDYKLQRQIIDSLQWSVFKYETAADLTTETLNEIIETQALRKELTKKERTRQWFQNRWKDLVAWLLGIIAATEAAFIAYQTISR